MTSERLIVLNCTNITYRFYQGGYMGEEKKPENNTTTKKKADPARVQVLRMLPLKIKESITKEEADAFLFGDICPDSLKEKLKDYIVED